MNVYEYMPTSGKYLEIGPLDNPFLKRPEFDVYYLDYNTTEKVKEIYAHSYADLSKIVNIDYSTGDRSYKETVGNTKFTGVYSSHCIEHTHDVIRHLTDVGEILEEGGRYVLCIPDKSNCFDYFRSATTFREAYTVYRGGNVNSFIADSVMNSSYYNKPGDVRLFWNKEVSFLPELLDEEPRVELANQIYGSENPLEFAQCCHFWTFTYDSLLEFVRDCLRFNLLPFSVEYHECTANDKNYNLYLVLKKNSKIQNDVELRLSEIIKLETFLENRKGIKNTALSLLNETMKKKVYIYGAGQKGKQLYKILKNCIDSKICFMISDDQECSLEGIDAEVFRVSDIEPAEDIVIIVATIIPEYYKEMTENLQSLGFKENHHYFKL